MSAPLGIAHGEIDNRVVAGIKLFVEDEAFRDASRESLRNVQEKIDEMTLAHKSFEDRIGRSSEVIEAMRAAGNDAFEKQTAFEEARRHGSDETMAQLSYPMAEVQQAMSNAMEPLNMAGVNA